METATKTPDFSFLLGKWVKLNFNHLQINRFKFIEITRTKEIFPSGRGCIFVCSVEWEKKIIGAYPVLDFDEQTLSELNSKGVSQYPFSALPLFYEIEI